MDTVMSGTSDITSTYSKEGSGRRRLRLPRLGPYSLRRANINMAAGSRRQQIETSKFAGHANTKITEEYHRPDEFLLVRRASQRVTAQSP